MTDGLKFWGAKKWNTQKQCAQYHMMKRIITIEQLITKKLEIKYNFRELFMHANPNKPNYEGKRSTII